MKNLKKPVKIILMVSMILFTVQAIAQVKSENETMKLVSASLAKKYPGANVKRWDIKNGFYTAKIVQNGQNCFATFDKNGAWVKSARKVSLFRKLPVDVEAGYKKSGYSRYHIFFVKDIETPADHYYQIMVDDSNHKIDALHQDPITKNWIVEVRLNGSLKQARSITDDIQGYLAFE